VHIAKHHAATRARAKVLIATLLFRDNLPSYTPNATKVIKRWTKLIGLKRGRRVIASEEPSMQDFIRCATLQAARRTAAMKVACCLNQFSPKDSGELRVKYAGSGLGVERLQHAFGHAVLVLGVGGRRFKVYTTSCEDAFEEGIIIFAAAVVAAKPPNGAAILSLYVRLHFSKGIAAGLAVVCSRLLFAKGLA
jgi:hypothetical protein